MKCESCATVGIRSEATTTRNGEHVCSDCAVDIDEREAEQERIRDIGYDAGGVRK